MFGHIPSTGAVIRDDSRTIGYGTSLLNLILYGTGVADQKSARSSRNLRVFVLLVLSCKPLYKHTQFNTLQSTYNHRPSLSPTVVVVIAVFQLSLGGGRNTGTSRVLQLVPVPVLEVYEIVDILKMQSSSFITGTGTIPVKQLFSNMLQIPEFLRYICG